MLYLFFCDGTARRRLRTAGRRVKPAARWRRAREPSRGPACRFNIEASHFPRLCSRTRCRVAPPLRALVVEVEPRPWAGGRHRALLGRLFFSGRGDGVLLDGVCQGPETRRTYARADGRRGASEPRFPFPSRGPGSVLASRRQTERASLPLRTREGRGCPATAARSSSHGGRHLRRGHAHRDRG